MDLCYDYPELSLGFQGILKARSGYRLDARIAKAAKLITTDYPNDCPCCNSETQTIEHWLMKCPTFLRILLQGQRNIKGNSIFLYPKFLYKS